MPNTNRPFHRPHRLDSGAYQDAAATFHITTRLYPGLGSLSPSLAGKVWSELCDQRLSGRVTLHAACLMPDHLHLLASPAADRIDRWVASFKSYTTRTWWESGGRGRFWQPSFHDVRVYPNEFASRLEYLYRNPATAGLVDDPGAWPYLGIWVND